MEVVIATGTVYSTYIKATTEEVNMDENHDEETPEEEPTRLEMLEAHYEAKGNSLPLLAALMDTWGISKGRPRG